MPRKKSGQRRRSERRAQDMMRRAVVISTELVLSKNNLRRSVDAIIFSSL